MSRLRPGSPVEIRENAILKRRLTEFLAHESGATAIEYCLIAAAIALAIIGLVNALGVKLAEKLSLIASQLK